MGVHSAWHCVCGGGRGVKEGDEDRRVRGGGGHSGTATVVH